MRWASIRNVPSCDVPWIPEVEETREEAVHVRSEVELTDSIAVVRHFYEGLPAGHRTDLAKHLLAIKGCFLHH